MSSTSVVTGRTVPTAPHDFAAELPALPRSASTMLNEWEAKVLALDCGDATATSVPTPDAPKAPARANSVKSELGACPVETNEADVPVEVPEVPEVPVAEQVQAAIKEGNIEFLKVAFHGFTTDDIALAVSEKRSEILAMMPVPRSYLGSTQATTKALVQAIKDGRESDAVEALKRVYGHTAETDAALEHNRLQVLQALIDQGGYPEITRRIVEVGITNDIVELLANQKRKAVAYNRIAFEAAALGNVKTVLTVIDNGSVNTNVRREVNDPVSGQNTVCGLLYVAAAHGHAGLVKELLAKGASADAVAQTGLVTHSPLGAAVKLGHTEVVRALLSVSQPGWIKKRKYVNLAKSNGHTEIEALLTGKPFVPAPALPAAPAAPEAPAVTVAPAAPAVSA